MKILKSAVIGLLSSLFLSALSVGAVETPRQERQENRAQFAKEHPRRAEVNKRVAHQKKQLNQQLKSGKITQAQYDTEMAKLKDVKQQERTDVKANGGHLTKTQQKGLNQELNATHQDIKNDNAPATPPAPPAQQ